MTLRGEFAQAAIELFDALDDVPRSCQYTKTTQITLPGGAVDNITDCYATRIIITSMAQTPNSNNEIQSGFLTGLIIAGELTEPNGDLVAPSIGDTLIVGEREYNVRNAEADPADAVHTLTLEES